VKEKKSNEMKKTKQNYWYQNKMQACLCLSLASLSEGLNLVKKNKEYSLEARVDKFPAPKKNHYAVMSFEKKFESLSCSLSPLFCFAIICVY
jgi:hypothetical protein